MDITSLASNFSTYFYSFLCYLPLIVVAILGLGLLIVIHEFGHLIFAKLFNVYAPSFSIGFGPRLFEKKIGETTYALSLIPFGGYVELAGSQEVGQGEQLHAKSTDDRSLTAKPYWQKMLILIGGIAFNLIFAYLALTLLAYMGTPCIGGLCNKKEPIIEKLETNSTSEKSGLKSGDKILSIDNAEIKTIKEFSEKVTPNINKTVNLKVLRDNQTLDIPLEIGEQTVKDKKFPKTGIYWHSEPLSLIASFKEGWNLTVQISGQIIHALLNITSKTAELGGPLLIVSQMAECAAIGFKAFLFILALISINLGIFNLIPLPIFDGGQAVFYTIEAITGKPLSEDIRYKIHYWTWIAVLILLVYFTYSDLLKIAAPFLGKK